LLLIQAYSTGTQGSLLRVSSVIPNLPQYLTSYTFHSLGCIDIVVGNLVTITSLLLRILRTILRVE